MFGTSAKYIDAAKKAGLARTTQISRRCARSLSTGSPLVAEGFDFVYRSVKEDLHLASISGGTDIVSCFVRRSDRSRVARRDPGPPASAWRSRCSTSGEAGARRGRAGLHEAVSVYAGRFLERSRRQRYRAAYFEQFPGVWSHGDYVELTAHGGMIIYGRSDAVLNPGGVRIGTAEIYRQVEQLQEVVEASPSARSGTATSASCCSCA